MPATTPAAPAPDIPLWVWPVAVLTALFLANAVPHTLAGPLILNLPTPFNGGPGALSTPMVNELWGLSNIVIGGLLLWRIRPWLGRTADDDRHCLRIRDFPHLGHRLPAAAGSVS